MRILIAFALIVLLGISCYSPSSPSTNPTQVLTKVEKTQDTEALNTTCFSDMVSIASDSLPAFSIQRTPVTVSMYEVFAKAANYTTQAETYGNSGVFSYEKKAWILVDGAYYKQPFGKTEGNAPEDHPATQVSYYDAAAFCAYYNMRLPTEQEWETAARYKQPVGSTSYPWGDSIRTTSGYRANVWQGIFPYDQKVEDGYAYTSPVEAYPAAPSGLRDMAGNVWEWTSDTISGDRLMGDDVHRIAKGGSFLCEPMWCHGYLISGSTDNSSETGLFHNGFRCVCEEK